jgi:hypothetical protein
MQVQAHDLSKWLILALFQGWSGTDAEILTSDDLVIFSEPHTTPDKRVR